MAEVTQVIRAHVDSYLMADGYLFMPVPVIKETIHTNISLPTEDGRMRQTILKTGDLLSDDPILLLG